MTLYLLDTNAISDLAANPGGNIAVMIGSVGAENVCTSVIVAGEIASGVEKKGSHRLKRQIESIMAALSVRALDRPADRHYGRLRALLRKQGRPIGPNDLFIAAHALALDATLVTANLEEFSRVPGLKVENWIKS